MYRLDRTAALQIPDSCITIVDSSIYQRDAVVIENIFPSIQIYCAIQDKISVHSSVVADSLPAGVFAEMTPWARTFSVFPVKYFLLWKT